MCDALSGAVAELLLTAVGVNSIPSIKGTVKNGDVPKPIKQDDLPERPGALVDDIDGEEQVRGDVRHDGACEAEADGGESVGGAGHCGG